MAQEVAQSIAYYIPDQDKYDFCRYGSVFGPQITTGGLVETRLVDTFFEPRPKPLHVNVLTKIMPVAQVVDDECGGFEGESTGYRQRLFAHCLYAAGFEIGRKPAHIDHKQHSLTSIASILDLQPEVVQHILETTADEYAYPTQRILGILRNVIGLKTLRKSR